MTVQTIRGSLTQTTVAELSIRGAETLGRAGQWTAAALLLETARLSAPRHIALLVLLAEALSEAGYYLEASGILEDVLAESPDEARAHFLLAACRDITGDLEGARRAAQRAVDLDPINTNYRARFDMLARMAGHA